MRFAIVFTLGIAAVSTASASLVVRVTVPQCYDTCVAEADSSGCSSVGDTKCLCNNPTFISQSVKCFEETCKGADLGDALSIGESVCLAEGATLSPVPATPTSGSAPASISKLIAAAAAHDSNSFVGLAAAVGLVALTIY